MKMNWGSIKKNHNHHLGTLSAINENKLKQIILVLEYD